MTDYTVEDNGGIEMERQFTEAELQEAAKAEPPLYAMGFANTKENWQLIHDSFKASTVPVTSDNILTFVEANRARFRFLTQAEKDYNQSVLENQTNAKELHEWFNATQGKPGTLVTDGEDGLRNFTILLNELRGRVVDHQRIQEALGRVMFKPNRLTWVPESRRVNAMQKSVDPDHKPGRL